MHAGIPLNSIVTSLTGSPDTVFALPLNVFPDTAGAIVDESVALAGAEVEESIAVDEGVVGLGVVIDVDVDVDMGGTGCVAEDVTIGVGLGAGVGLGDKVTIGVGIGLNWTGDEVEGAGGTLMLREESGDGADAVVGTPRVGVEPGRYLSHPVRTTADTVIASTRETNRRVLKDRS